MSADSFSSGVCSQRNEDEREHETPHRSSLEQLKTSQLRQLAATKPGGTEPILIFADVFDPAQSQLDGMVRLFEVRDFVAEEWPHVLIWDLFVGRAIWLDSLKRDTPFTWASLLLCNGIGPPGLLLYVLLCLGSGRGLPTLGYEGDE